MKKKHQQIKASGRGQTTPRAQDFLTKLDWRISLDMGPKWGPPTVSPRLDLGTFHEQSWVHRADPLRSTSCEVSRWASHTLRSPGERRGRMAELSLEALGLPSVYLPGGGRKVTNIT